jgi:hydroxyacylglutathione hydrolase
MSQSFEKIKVLSPEEFKTKSAEGIVIDTRLPEAFAGAHIKGSYSIWLEGLPVFGGHVGEHKKPLYLVLEDERDLKEAFLYLSRIGMDNIDGVLTQKFESWRDYGLPFESSGTITPKDLHDRREDYYLLDVREISEFEEEHIPDAYHCYVGDLGRMLDEIQTEKPIVVTCSVGHRASLGVSLLLKAGRKNVFNLLGGVTAWKKLDLPLHKGEAQSFFSQTKGKSPLPLEQQLNS